MPLTDAEQLSFRIAIDRALAEDEVHTDITTLACIDDDIYADAIFRVKQEAKIAGLFLIPQVFHCIDPHIEVDFEVEEGAVAKKGTILATVHGKARSILSAERVALNLLQHICGVATQTSHFVKEVENFSCDILDTRKTLPGLRALQKYAVRIGGGTNHRLSLSDRILIKDNHLHLLGKTHANPIQTAVMRAKAFKPNSLIEVEVSNLDQMEIALQSGADIILLDNMAPDMLHKAVAMNNGKTYLEASGGVTLENVLQIASTGVNGISIGALTHSAPSVDINMKFSYLKTGDTQLWHQHPKSSSLKKKQGINCAKASTS